MAETKPLTAYWMHDVIRISEPLTIRKARMAAGSPTSPTQRQNGDRSLIFRS